MRLWAARLLILIVTAWNLECALVFLLDPGAYVAGFELAGIPGEAAVRGTAVLFIMWNVPYIVAAFHPRRHRTSLWEALAMQVIGLAGESFILLSLTGRYGMLHSSLVRFIVFDAAGVLLLLGAVAVASRVVKV